MKRLTSLLLLFSLTTCPLAFGEDFGDDDTTFYTEEDDQLFNRGTFVGSESDDYLRAVRRQKAINWTVAAGSTAVGIVALLLAGSSHN